MFSAIAIYFSNTFAQIGARFTVSSAYGQILFSNNTNNTINTLLYRRFNNRINYICNQK